MAKIIIFLCLSYLSYECTSFVTIIVSSCTVSPQYLLQCLGYNITSTQICLTDKKIPSLCFAPQIKIIICTFCKYFIQSMHKTQINYDFDLCIFIHWWFKRVNAFRHVHKVPRTSSVLVFMFNFVEDKVFCSPVHIQG